MSIPQRKVEKRWTVWTANYKRCYISTIKQNKESLNKKYLDTMLDSLAECPSRCPM